MISEQEVIDSLDRFGKRINDLKSQVAQLTSENESLHKQLEDGSNVQKQYECAMKAVEDTIESKYKPLVAKLEEETRTLGERVLQLQKDNGSLTNKINEQKVDIERLKGELDKKDQTLKAINNRLKSFSKAPSSDLDIDSMITKIHNSKVETSAVDNEMDKIRKERFTDQYEWGRATKETVIKFVEFVERLWEGYAIVGNNKILNRIPDVKGGLDDNTVNTFLHFLLDKGLIQRRDNGEIITTYELKDIIERITKKC